MSVSTAHAHIKKSGSEPAALQRNPRLRVSQIVADYLAHGWSPEEMCRQHSSLTLSEAYSAMAYYFDNAAEIDAELESELKHAERDRTDSPASKMVSRLRAQGRI